MSGSKVLGLRDAADYARVQRVVREWIASDDVPLAAKMVLHPKHVNALVDRLCGSKARIAELEAPFRNADALDWEHLFKMLPDSGHGQFWKAVMSEARKALSK